MAKHHGKHRAAGGRGTGKYPEVAAGSPVVVKEAEGKEPYENKKGGRVHKKHKDGGKVVLGHMTGGAVRPRLDRPGRKHGGRVGSNEAPLSTAHRPVSSEAYPKSND